MKRTTATRPTRSKKTAAPKQRRASARAPRIVLPPPIPHVAGSSDEFDRALPLARTLDANDVIPFRADISLAYYNIAAGVSAVLEQRERITRELPTLDIGAIEDLPGMALAVAFADSRVARGQESDGSTQVLLARAHMVREVMLTAAISLARAGHLPAKQVAKIQEGHGLIDAAKDCIELAALFKRHAAKIRGKSPITREHVDEAASVGAQLLALLRPRGARRKQTAEDVTAAIDARDRIWTMLIHSYDVLRRTAYWLWGEDFNEFVPTLQSRSVPARQPRETIIDVVPDSVVVLRN